MVVALENLCPEVVAGWKFQVGSARVDPSCSKMGKVDCLQGFHLSAGVSLDVVPAFAGCQIVGLGIHKAAPLRAIETPHIGKQVLL